MGSTRRLRELLEMQGYVGLCDKEIRKLAPWLKVAPATCAAVALFATIQASPTTLWSLSVMAFLGAALPTHPFDLPYQLLLSGRNGRPRIPASALPKRFACTVATAWLAMTGAAFAAGSATLGYILGGLFFATAMVPVTTDLCVPSFVWSRVLGLPAASRAGKLRRSS